MASYAIIREWKEAIINYAPARQGVEGYREGIKE